MVTWTNGRHCTSSTRHIYYFEGQPRQLIQQMSETHGNPFLRLRSQREVPPTTTTPSVSAVRTQCFSLRHCQLSLSLWTAHFLSSPGFSPSPPQPEETQEQHEMTRGKLSNESVRVMALNTTLHRQTRIIQNAWHVRCGLILSCQNLTALAKLQKEAKLKKQQKLKGLNFGFSSMWTAESKPKCSRLFTPSELNFPKREAVLTTSLTYPLSIL